MDRRNDAGVGGDQRIRLNLKRKNSNQYATCINGATPTEPTMNDFGKQRKLEGWKGQNYGSQSRRFLLTCYSNFKKSGVPRRLMFNQNDEWIDFPEDLYALVKKNLQEKQVAIDVKFNGRHCLLDFLHMIYFDFETGLQHPIAWIDEEGKCFFPKIFANDDEANVNGQYEDGRNEEASSLEPLEIKLQIEIEVNGLEKSTSEEHNGDSNALVGRVQDDQRTVDNLEATQVEDSSNRHAAPNFSLQQPERQGIMSETNGGKLDIDNVRRMFLEGMGSSGNLEILNIYQCSSPFQKSRLELFEKQIEITRAYRGSANVQYAWLASSEKEISTIIMHGLIHCGDSLIKSEYGIGAHLTSVNYAHTSARYCKVGRNGLLHMILCRVILGTLEVIRHGSMQFHPGSLRCDTGVDDLYNPKHYTVWDSNINTHIYPEYVVIFKMVSDSVNEGYLVRSEANRDISKAPILTLQAGSSIARTGSSARVGSNPFRIPRSPWIPFSTLFAAISTQISPRNMEVINENYKLFQARRMTRDDFVKLLRSIVGDTLLKSTISRLEVEAQAQQMTANTVKAPKCER